jgi:hypothetical protein
MLIPFWLSAQSAENSWDNLKQVGPGRKIQVVDKKLKAVEGEFVSFTNEAITLRAGQDQVSIPRTEVFSVKDREGSRRGRNVLLGLAIGAGAGAVIGAVRGKTYHEEGETPVFMAVWTPIGAGIGAGLGAALPTGQKTIYRAPGR